MHDQVAGYLPSTCSSIHVKERRKQTRELNDQDFVQQALASLSQSKSLRSLQLQPFSGVLHSTDNSFSPISRFSYLRHLDISHFIVTDSNVASISEAV
jgi:hypothetical protein